MVMADAKQPYIAFHEAGMDAAPERSDPLFRLCACALSPYPVCEPRFMTNEPKYL